MKIKHKLFNRLFITTAAVMVVCVVVSIALLSFVTANYFTKEKKRVLLVCCDTVAACCKGETGEINQKFSSVSEVIAASAGADILLTDPAGRPLFCSCDEWAEGGACVHSVTDYGNKFLKQAQAGSHFKIRPLKGQDGLHYTAVGKIKTEKGETSGYVICISSAASLKKFYTHLRRLYIFAALVTVIVMFGAQYLATYRITRPLRQMSMTARRLAKGDFSGRIPVTGNDELGELALAFNQMTDSLSRLESTRRGFIANVSHELKTPITTISGFVDGIMDGTIPPEKQPYYLKIISDETKWLSRVVESMLSLAKLESGNAQLNLHRFDMASLLCAVVVSREQSISQKKIEITGLSSLAPIFVRADRDLIHQVVYNLVDNAVKFTDEGGYIDFSVCAVANGVQVKIKNSGKGISRDALPMIFERFYKEDRSRSQSKNSAGLGLYLAKTIIELHGGKIGVNCKENEFAEFEFLLPDADKQANISRKDG